MSAVCRRLAGALHATYQHSAALLPSTSAPQASRTAPYAVSRHLLRHFASGKQEGGQDKAEQSANATDQKADEEPAATSSKAGGADSSDDDEAGPSIKDLTDQLKQKEQQAEKLTQQVEVLTDSLKRTLADMENLRARTVREVDNTKKFAVQGLLKSLLDVPDNLERAAGAVPEDVQQGADVPVDKLKNILSGLLGGVRATEAILLKVLNKHGVEQYNPIGEPFDPNMHSALFDVPDPNKENNTIAVVTKRGYKLNDRVIRPAEVGVVKNPQSSST